MSRYRNERHNRRGLTSPSGPLLICANQARGRLNPLHSEPKSASAPLGSGVSHL